MSAITVHADVRELDLLNRELGLYAQLSGKTIEETLDKKGRDLGIQLYRGFSEAKWGGPGKAAGIAKAELAARTAAGRGTVVREVLRRRYREVRAELNFDVRSYGQARRQAREHGTLDQWTAARDKGNAARRKRAHLWRRIVGEETALRQSGRGALAASFLLFRRARRFSTSKGRMVDSLTRDFVKNRTGKAAGYLERGPGFLRIVGLTPGLAEVDARFSIVERSARAVRADMAPYLRRKLIEGMGPFKKLKASP